MLFCAVLLASLAAVVPAQSANAPQNPTTALDSAEALLVAGDTAPAVRLLERIGVVDTSMDSRALAALFALRWIAHGPGQDEAVRVWRSAVDTAKSFVAGSIPAMLLTFLARVDAGQSASAIDTVMALELGLRWQAKLEDLSADTLPGDPLLSGDAAWTLATYHLPGLDSALTAALPRVRAPPGECPPPLYPFQCVSVHDALRSDWGLHWIVADNVGAQLQLEDQRTYLERAIRHPWPFDELAAREWMGLEAALSGRPGLMSALRRVRAAPGLRPEVVSQLAVIGDEFSGKRDAAEREMEAHEPWYTPLDTMLAFYGGTGGLSPAAFWRLAWPLYLEPYNERLTVHRARLLLSDVFRHMRIGLIQYGLNALLDPTKTTVRGLPLAMVVVGPPDRRLVGWLRYVSIGDPASHETVLPLRGRDAVFAGPLDMALAARDTSELRTTTGFVAEAYDEFLPFPHQIAQLMRDGRPDVFLYDEAPLCAAHDPAIVGFYLLDERLGLLHSSVDTLSWFQRRRTLELHVAPGTYVYSLEMLEHGCRRAARARYLLTVRPDTGALTSDLVLSDSVRFTDAERIAAAPPILGRGRLTITPGAPLHLYWEVYGAPSTNRAKGRLRVRVAVVDVRRHRVPVRRLSQVARAAGKAHAAMDIAYRADLPAGQGPVGMALSIALPENARGVYLARVEVTDQRTGRRGVAERWFRVVPSDGAR